jgi:hypothetical protein
MNGEGQSTLRRAGDDTETIIAAPLVDIFFTSGRPAGYPPHNLSTATLAKPHSN